MSASFSPSRILRRDLWKTEEEGREGPAISSSSFSWQGVVSLMETAAQLLVYSMTLPSFNDTPALPTVVVNFCGATRTLFVFSAMPSPV